MIVYKVLRSDGTPRYQSQYRWPMPKGDEPGDWAEVSSSQTLALCEWGLHGWRTMERAIQDITEPDRMLVYEMELDDGAPIVDRPTSSQGRDKVCGRRARIVRAVANKEGPLVFLADYVWQ